MSRWLAERLSGDDVDLQGCYKVIIRYDVYAMHTWEKELDCKGSAWI